MRKVVKLRLHCEDNLSTSELHYMREHPEDMKWLKAHIRPRLWRKFVAAMNANRSPGDPILEE
jgi:hypothetical protein